MRHVQPSKRVDNIELGEDAPSPGENIFPFPIHAYMQSESMAMITHLNNLVATFGEQFVKEYMMLQFNLVEMGE